MSPHDEELQKAMENEYQPDGGDPDARAYDYVFRALEREPSFALPKTFSEGVVNLVIENKKREARRDLFWLIAGVVFILIAFVITLVTTDFRLELGFLKSILKYSGVFIFGAAFVFLLNLLDKKLIRKSFSPD